MVSKSIAIYVELGKYSSPFGMKNEQNVPQKVVEIAPSPQVSQAGERIIIVASVLPLSAARKPENLGWSFGWDKDSLLLQLRDGLGESTEVVYVGCLSVEIDPKEQDVVAATLLGSFNCVPAFCHSDLKRRYYHGFCKQQLWPLFHYMLPLTPDHGGRFDRSLWQAYVSVNNILADRVIEVISPDEDSVWIHDYHLMLLPIFLRKRFNKMKIGFFLHSPFPWSEIARSSSA
jgi:trehalose 6-phosphate synthase/phosphatase